MRAERFAIGAKQQKVEGFETSGAVCILSVLPQFTRTQIRRRISKMPEQLVSELLAIRPLCDAADTRRPRKPRPIIPDIHELLWYERHDHGRPPQINIGN